MTPPSRASGTSLPIAGSFRDPSGFIFERDGVLYRQVNVVYREHYRRLMTSGLYDTLQAQELLVPHEEVAEAAPRPEEAFCVIRPERIPFISYPYEWCFGELKDAALTTLAIQKRAMEHGLSLKDASAYNIQFRDGRPVLIDTLSFETYVPGQPWVAYRQFCQHFVAPLALMTYTDVRLAGLLRVYPDGIPLDLASRLLPLRTRLRFSLLSHVHLHASGQKRYAAKALEASGRRLGRFALRALIDSLESAISGLHWKAAGTAWADYYAQTNYSPEAFEHKKQLVAEFLKRLQPGTVWDLGANVGPFSRIAASQGIRTIAFDSDAAAVETLYQDVVQTGQGRLLPLLMDLTNPSPAMGWDLREHRSLEERGPADTALVLGLIHHLAIANNVPLGRLADWLGRLARSVIVEFVPKGDSQVSRLLALRPDIFPDYTEEGFQHAFQGRFQIEDRQPIRDSVRVLYLLRRR